MRLLTRFYGIFAAGTKRDIAFVPDWNMTCRQDLIRKPPLSIGEFVERVDSGMYTSLNFGVQHARGL